MALDGIFIYSLLNEFKSKLLNGRVDKINQPESDEIILSIRSEKNTYKLLISASAVYPKIHITEFNKPNPIKAPMFCMILRKYLTSAKIVHINQISTDRVIIFDFQNTDEFGFDSLYSLIVEIMGRHSNITLVRKKDNMIMDSIKHVTAVVNTYRCLYPNIEFVYPPKSTKLSPFDFTYDDLISYIDKNNIIFDNNFFSNVFTGISRQFSKELYLRCRNNNIDFESKNLPNIYSFINQALSNIKKCDFYFASYSVENKLKDFYCTKLTSLCESKIKQYPTPSKLIEEFYFDKDKSDRLNSKSADLQKIVNRNLDRCTKKIKLLKDLLKDCQNKEKYRIQGELLTANIYLIKKGLKELKVLNYYSKDEEYITIPLDSNKSPSQNVQRYFKKYNKLKKSDAADTVQLKYANEEVDYLESVLTNIKNSDNYEEIEEIRKELIQTGYIKFKKSDKSKKSKRLKPMHFVSSDGIDIYVGKNNIQNDYLTLKFANKHDTWLHTKNIPGSHVIIKKCGEIPDTTLNEAAKLAAYYSKAKDSSKVPVDYTEVKNIRKPSGAKPGMVIYYTNKTIYTDPEKPKLADEN